MNKLFFILILVGAGLLVFAQGTHPLPLTDSLNKDAAQRHYILLHQGTVIVVRNGDSLPVAVDLFLTDGSIVKKEGIIQLKNGQSLILKKEKRFFLMIRQVLKFHQKEQAISNGISAFNTRNRFQGYGTCCPYITAVRIFWDRI